jgi:hypothetical protein
MLKVGGGIILVSGQDLARRKIQRKKVKQDDKEKSKTQGERERG